ncbi:hypothetical protein PJW08_04010 [Tenacibaculum finnmarkense]|nr:hypothetical protein PJW08_04010 [Tenacibaculum finnmarkense]
MQHRATITIPLGNVLPTTDDLTSTSISSDAGATDIVNPTGNDTDGTVENYKITSLPIWWNLIFSRWNNACNLKSSVNSDGSKWLKI